MHTTHTSRSQSRSGSHVSHRENTMNMQLEIDHLRRKLRRKQRRRTSSISEPSFNDDNDDSYKPSSWTPPSESYSCSEDCHYRRRSKSPSHRGLGNDAMSRALHQFLSHRLHVGLKEENFLNDLLSQHLPCIMVERTLWSTSATSTKEWLFTQRMKP